jgi:hypothetical protein
MFDPREAELYIEAVEKSPLHRVKQWLTRRCTECGQYGVEDPSSHALGSDGAVLIGCGGYWQVNPNVLPGFDKPNWQDWTAGNGDSTPR